MEDSEIGRPQTHDKEQIDVSATNVEDVRVG